MAKAKVAAGKAATGQRPLNVRERQAIGALTGYADKINTTNPGAIHSTEVVVSRRGLHVKVVYNRDRGMAIADAQPDDGAGTPAPGRSKPTKPAAGKPKAHKAAGSTPNAPADQAGFVSPACEPALRCLPALALPSKGRRARLSTRPKRDI